MSTPTTWYADGGISGFNPATGTLTAERTKFVTAGTVDAEGVTRSQYSIQQGQSATRLNAVARISVGWDDYFFAVAEGKPVSANLYVLPASSFGEGLIPTPLQIMYQVGRGHGSVYRASQRAADVPVNGTKDYAFTIAGPDIYDLQPNTKYWALLIPVFRGSRAALDVPVTSAPLNTIGRAVSFWTNRTPNAPVINSPTTGVVVNASQTITLSIDTQDPDEIVGGTTPAYRDVAGVQVQYAPRPTEENPSPTWTDLPFSTASGVVSPGWYIKGARVQNGAVISSPSPDDGGAATLWSTGTVQIKCGSNTITPGTGALPSGTWQIRVRTFDYGHPFPATTNPLGRFAGNYNPSTYPATNTSPWSAPVHVTITDQVPPPLTLSPANRAAIPAGRPVTLSWQYRNTAVPPYAQGTRMVQLRRVGDPDWLTLASGASSAQTLTIEPNGTVDLGEYLADPSFENGTTDGWSAGSGGSLTVLATGGYDGGRALQVNASPQNNYTPASREVSISPSNGPFRFTGRVYVPTSATVDVSIIWTNNAQTVLGTANTTVTGPGWQDVALLNRTAPNGATKAVLYVDAPTGVTVRLDDLSFRDSASPGPVSYSLDPTTQYEWRVQVTDSTGARSNFSQAARFWIVPAPSSGEELPVPSNTIDGATLGCGKHRVEIYRRGGKVRVGEITNLSHVDWGRVRDDISNARIVVSGWDIDCGNLLANLKTWAYEIVIYRDNGYSVDRVWEGPITLLRYERDSVTIQAKDMLGYAYRRIIKQKMSDAGKGDSVVSRAARVLQNVFAEDDPNLLSYLTVIARPDDAKQYRSVPPYARTAFEEIDDMASYAGLDFAAVGRAILLWGTKQRIGTLPEFRDEDLGSPPVVTEYGLSMANRYAVTDGNGTYGVAERLDVSGNDETYGLVEMLSSSWASDSGEATDTYTQEGRAKVIASFEGYAENSISSRYPAPVSVRVPENTTLNPGTPISIQHLVPGVAIPLRSNGTLRSVATTQKLDAVRVVEENGVETISISMSSFAREDRDIEETEE